MDLKHSSLDFYPLTLQRWDDFEKLFGTKGAFGGCWCMWWRLTKKQFEAQQGQGNREAMKAIVASGEIPGILAYNTGEPVAWCSVAPRSSYSSLNRSRVLKPLDEIPVWSIVCMFIKNPFRGKGMATALVRAAIDYVRSQGGSIVEAYPTPPKDHPLPPYSSFMGLPSIYEDVGFIECARPSKSKVIMRFYIDPPDENRPDAPVS